MSTQNEKKNKSRHSLYIIIFEKEIKKYVEGTGIPKDSIKKIIFYGMKSFTSGRLSRISIELPQKDIADVVVREFQFISQMMKLVGNLTPLEFTNIFPPEKTFDGKKYGKMDYFSTIQNVKNFGDSLIGENKALKFLMNYHNTDVLYFVHCACMVIDDACYVSGKSDESPLSNPFNYFKNCE